MQITEIQMKEGNKKQKDNTFRDTNFIAFCLSSFL